MLEFVYRTYVEADKLKECYIFIDANGKKIPREEWEEEEDDDEEDDNNYKKNKKNNKSNKKSKEQSRMKLDLQICDDEIGKIRKEAATKNKYD